jgi:6-pyruvoyltetrahydropterin/6-carboxytetrahydropterin synthase
MYTLTVEGSFSSAHQLRGYRGKCENLHGHNWKVVLSVRGETLDQIGLLIDFNELKTILRSILDGLDHKNINDIPYFAVNNPSSENIARFIADQFSAGLESRNHPAVILDSVTVWESDTSRCTYTP